MWGNWFLDLLFSKQVGTLQYRSTWYFKPEDSYVQFYMTTTTAIILSGNKNTYKTSVNSTKLGMSAEKWSGHGLINHTGSGVT